MYIRLVKWVMISVALPVAGPQVVVGATAVSNLANPDPPGQFLPTAFCSFTTGQQPALLNSISVRFFATSTFGMTLSASLLSDSAGTPGAPLVEQFPAQTDPSASGAGTATFPSAGTLLAPNTTYWLYLNTQNATWWETTSLFTETSPYGWAIGNQIYDGTSYPAVGRLSIDATILPEPTAACAFSLLLPLLRRPRRPRRPAPRP